MNTAFPLLRLPSDVLTETLKLIDFLEQIAFSLVSKKSKTLVMSLNLECEQLRLDIDQRVRLLLYSNTRTVSFDFVRHNQEIPSRLIMNNFVEIGYYRYPIYWRKEGYGVRDWIDHMMTITHQSNIKQIEFARIEQGIDIDSIKNAIKGLNIETLHANGGSQDFQAILESFPLKSIKLNRLPYPNIEPIYKYLVQNQEAISVGIFRNLKLAELLMMNSRGIEMSVDSEDTLLVFNRFLKLWKIGSNPRLEYVFMFFPILDYIPNVSIALKGIAHEIVPQTEHRTIQFLDFTMTISGGFNIVGRNGRKATINLMNSRCIMTVWPE